MAYYVSRQGLGAIVPLSRAATGIGAYLWSDFRSGLSAGLDPPSEECPQPVHTDERDELRNRIKAWTYPAERKHFVEGHPDVGAVYDDIVGRLRGLEQRPKLLRCSKEARNRASTWLAQLDDLGRRVRPNYPGAGFTTVPQTFSFAVFRGPTYTVRASSLVGQGAAPAPPSAPPGSVVVNGQVYASSKEATAATQPVQTVGGGGAFEPSPGAPAAGGFLESELVPGIPNTYLVYGAGGLLLFRMLKGK